VKISCTSTIVPGDSLTKKAENLKAWGYDGIAVFVDYQDWNEELHQELLKLQDRTGIIPCEFVFGDPIYGHLMDEDRQIRNQCRDMYRLAARVSGELGAVTELEFEYGPQNPLPLFHPYQKMTEQQEEAFLEMYRYLLEPLKGTDGRMLIEGINRYESPYLNCLRDCKAVVDKLDHENAGVLADFFHMSIEEKNLPQSILETGAAIKHVHLGDNNRLLPGYGTIDWDLSLKALKQIGYDGFLNLECCAGEHPEKTLPETVRFLRGKLEDNA